MDIRFKLTVLRTTDDCIIDEGGSRQNINANDLERDVEVAPVARAKKLNIPIPIGKTAEDYETRIIGGYEPPVSYIRLVRKINEADAGLEYVLEQSDVVSMLGIEILYIPILYILWFHKFEVNRYSFFCYKYYICVAF